MRISQIEIEVIVPASSPTFHYFASASAIASVSVSGRPPSNSSFMCAPPVATTQICLAAVNSSARKLQSCSADFVGAKDTEHEAEQHTFIDMVQRVEHDVAVGRS